MALVLIHRSMGKATHTVHVLYSIAHTYIIRTPYGTVKTITSVLKMAKSFCVFAYLRI